MELIYATLHKLRTECNFQGYIHVKAIPGANLEIVRRVGFLADRMSVNLELPTKESLHMLAPHKSRKNILAPMRLVQNGMLENKQELAVYRHAPQFVPAGQSTQMIIGATPETDYQIMQVTETLYEKFGLKRVFYSGFVPVNEDKALPAVTDHASIMLREHRLYQADWLIRYYEFKVSELLNEKNPNFNVWLDPKCNWAVQNLEVFPVEINSAEYHVLLRVPGIGYKSAGRIVRARKFGKIDFPDLKKMGVVLKRALYFITCNGKMMYATKMEQDYIVRNLIDNRERLPDSVRCARYEQLSLFDDMGTKSAVWNRNTEGKDDKSICMPG